MILFGRFNLIFGKKKTCLEVISKIEILIDYIFVEFKIFSKFLCQQSVHLCFRPDLIVICIGVLSDTYHNSEDQ